jgi:hypothetical protein
MIDRHGLLATLKPLVGELEDSIRERALLTPRVAEHLDQEHHKALAAKRTAMSLDEWREGEITQAAVAWVLACVFVRFLEDNGLIDQPLISGPGNRRAVAIGHREEHFRANPVHSDREYLEACFADVATFPAAAPLYDRRHNPLWRLGPTADGARVLRETFAAINPDSGELMHDFGDPELGTRFLGDLYQDMSEAAKKRYALLQTPEFVERFILDHTLTPAIAEFGLDDVRVIDPACGSGHFLIGAFERLFGLWTDREVGTTPTVLAQRALDQIAGVDLNPYATAIARFRLVITAVRACRIKRLAEMPAFKLRLATGDSLLHGPLPADGATTLFDPNRLNKNISHVYETEDAADLKEILGRGYHAVVGNPPYIAVQDAALRDAYRTRYASCHGAYVLTVPFMERFFELAQVSEGGRTQAGFVGKITGNSFMKREFGAPLVERFLPTLDLCTVVDTSGAHIPGHGTPTVLIFGRSRQPTTSTLRVVDGIRGEPKQPAEPANGLVWTSIEALVDRPGEQDQFVRSSDVHRAELLTHPMSLGIGRSLRKTLETGRAKLASLSADSGFGAVTRENDVYLLPPHVARARSISSKQTVALISGDQIRDWGITNPGGALWPYDKESLQALESLESTRFLWPWKRQLSERVAFGKTQIERGLTWFEYSMFFRKRFGTPSIVFAFVATDNHFALDRGQRVFIQSAPLIKLPHGTSEDQHLGLLGLLNSSVACFWFKQVCHNKGGGGIGGGIAEEAWEQFYEYTGTKLAEFPLTSARPSDLPTALHEAARERHSLLESLGESNGDALVQRLGKLRARDKAITAQMISVQEELDWQMLSAYGLVPEDFSVLGLDAPPIDLGQRAFEIVLARQVERGEVETTWFERHGSTPITRVPAGWPDDYRALVARRVALIETDSDVDLVERPEHKRRWNRSPWAERQREALLKLVLDALDDGKLWSDLRLRSTNELTDLLRRRPLYVEALELLSDSKDVDITATLEGVLLDAAVPHLAAERLTEKALRKRRLWEATWELQRAEDRGDSTGPVSVPPKYAQADFRSATFWKYRGKLDVPKERFVLVPNAERGADRSSVLGWAGWDECDLARAVAGRVMELREQEAADAARVAPLLAGVLELLPWIHQWHPENDTLYGGPPGQYFEGWLDGQLAELGITRDNLVSWRPPAPTRGRKKKVGAA